MTDRTLIYTITSTCPENYNVIRTNLQVPFGDFCKLTVTNMTTKATFILLNTHDYIIIKDETGEKTIFFQKDYGELSYQSFAALLEDLLENDKKYTVKADNVGRLSIHSTKEFTIVDMSYNTKMVSGMYNESFPIQSKFVGNEYIVEAQSVGFSLSTPILYLVSNLGAKCYDNVDENYCDRKVLMRVSNSFTSGFPIINSNAEFSSIVPCNSLSNIEFRLVDANMHDVRLLTPMYLSVETSSIEDENDETKIDVQQLQQQQLLQQIQQQQLQQQTD